MKAMIGLTLLLMSITVNAKSAAIYYTEGSLAGQVADHTGYLGYESACYKGNPWAARQRLINMASEDYEKDEISVWFNQSSKELEFSFVDTKCLDDSLDATADGCRSEVSIPKC